MFIQLGFAMDAGLQDAFVAISGELALSGFEHKPQRDKKKFETYDEFDDSNARTEAVYSCKVQSQPGSSYTLHQIPYLLHHAS